MIKLNGHEIKPTIFPDKTSQIWKISDLFVNGRQQITWEFESESEIIQLKQLADLVEFKRFSASLYMPYLPYGRQDKPVSDMQTFALLSLSRIINSMGFWEVKTLDAHSRKFNHFFKSAENILPNKEIRTALIASNPDVIVIPDSGAKRYLDMPILEGYPYCIGEKERDEATGYITNYEIDGEVDSRKCLIIDDICDGGMTFKLLAAELLSQGAAEVNLYVTHGIFSKGIQTLKDAGINRIFTHKGEIK
jgi:ribose-phosphate pyrophosphokinase